MSLDVVAVKCRVEMISYDAQLYRVAMQQTTKNCTDLMLKLVY